MSFDDVWEDLDKLDGQGNGVGRDSQTVPSAASIRKIEDICTRFRQNNLHRDYVGSASNQLIMGLGIPADEKVFLAWDDSFFKNGTIGFAVGERGLYVRNRWESARFIPYTDVPNAHVHSDKRDVYIGEHHVAVYMGVYKGGLPKLVSLFADIVQALHE